MACVACDTPKNEQEDGVAAALQAHLYDNVRESLPSGVDWSCELCTVINPGNRRNCSVCRAPKLREVGEMVELAVEREEVDGEIVSVQFRREVQQVIEEKRETSREEQESKEMQAPEQKEEEEEQKEEEQKEEEQKEEQEIVEEEQERVEEELEIMEGPDEEEQNQQVELEEEEQWETEMALEEEQEEQEELLLSVHVSESEDNSL